MPTYNTLADLPPANSIATWQAFNARLCAAPEMAWLNNNVIRHDIGALRAEDAPLLSTVKVADDWKRKAVGRNPPYDVNYDFGIRLYFWDGDILDGVQTTVAIREARYDQIEQATEVMVRVIRSEYMACFEPYWKILYIAGGERSGRTTYISKVDERLFTTTRIQLLRAFRPGQ